MYNTAPDFKLLDTRLVQAVIPDYGLHMDSSHLVSRGDELKKLFPSLVSWPSVTLAEAEVHQDVLVNMSRNMNRDSAVLPLPIFLENLFSPYLHRDLPTNRASLFFISTKNHRAACQKYEQEIYNLQRALEEIQSKKYISVQGGGPYKCLLECREAALEIKALSSDTKVHLPISRLEYIDNWLLKQAAELHSALPSKDQEMWASALEASPAGIAYRSKS